MSAIRITDLAKELNVSVNELMTLKTTKLDATDYKGVGKNTWFSEAGIAKIRLAIDIPLAVPNQFIGMVLSNAKNPNWVYCEIVGIGGKKPVAIPRRLRGKLLNKRIPIHAITDATGTTYRHALLTGYNQ